MKISAIVPVYNTENMSDEFIERQTELENCTFVKTILMLLVILCHSIDFWSGGGGFQPLRQQTIRRYWE